jgi:hypothetical protein
MENCKITFPKHIVFLFQDSIVAFNFASEDDARSMKTVLNDKLEAKKQRRLGEFSFCL